MNTSLSHLPEKNQFEINHIVEIIKEVINPEMIILFGSYAKGTQVNHKYQNKDGTILEYTSDYDFLVVVKKVTQDTSDKEWIVEEKAEIFNPPVNLEIHEIDFINYGLERGQYFFADILKEGIVLYDVGTISFSEPRQLSITEKKQLLEDYYSKWFTQGNGFLNGATYYIKRCNYNLAAFMLHQASECFFNLILLTFTGYKPKTHNLKKLRRKTKQYSEELYFVFLSDTDKQEKHLLELLKQAYIDARYKPTYNIKESEAKEILSKVKKISKIVDKVVKEYAESF